MKSYNLYPFQKEAVAFFERRGGRAILADDPGLGKTISTLGYVRNHPEIERALIVCPAVVTIKWREEISKWLDKDSQVVFTQADKLTEPILIMSYDMMRLRYEDLQDAAFDLLVLDESHYIKSYKASRTKVAKRIAKKADKIILLSGTPVPSRPMELFEQLHIVDPSAWKNPFSFGNRYCSDEAGHFTGAKNLTELQKRIAYIFLKRTKDVVADQLPKLQRTVLPFRPKSMKEYRQVERGVIEALKEMNPDHKGYHFGALDRLNDLRHMAGMMKAEVAIEWIEDFLEGDEKLVVYCHHRDVVAKIQGAVGGQVITGDTSQQARADIIKAFQYEPTPRVVTITSAGGQGIDLFGVGDVKSRCVIMVEREYTPAMEEQAEARLHRLGQANPVNAYYLLAQGTIDERMNRLIEKKRAVIKGIHALFDVQETIVSDLISEYIGG